MIAVDDLLALFERMLLEHWTYEWGAAREGCVDCSGAFVFAYKQLGGPTIAHGSNSILRQSMGALLTMNEAKPGYAAVKIRPWDGEEIGNRWYGQEPGDCYHIGLVGRDGRILNAQSTETGFVSSSPIGWSGCAPLLSVDYSDQEGGVTAVYQASVETERDPLRVRAQPIDGIVLGTIPKGAVVEVLEDAGHGWPLVRYNALEGYASGEFLKRIENAAGNKTTTFVRDDGSTITLFGSWRVENG